MLACLRHARDIRTLLEDLRAWNETMQQVLESAHGLRAMALVLRYMYQAARDVDPGEIRALVAGALGPKLEEQMRSAADILMEEGRQKGLEEGLEEGLQKGRQEGRQEGRAETLLKLLKLKFGKVPPATSARVRAAAPDVLDLWTERVLTAKTLAEVLAR